VLVEKRHHRRPESRIHLWWALRVSTVLTVGYQFEVVLLGTVRCHMFVAWLTVAIIAGVRKPHSTALSRCSPPPAWHGGAAVGQAARSSRCIRHCFRPCDGTEVFGAARSCAPGPVDFRVGRDRRGHGNPDHPEGSVIQGDAVPDVDAERVSETLLTTASRADVTGGRPSDGAALQ
jgi:hypothetical protein